MELVNELPKNLFSPFKTLLVGYFVLVFSGKLRVANVWQFLLITIPITVLEIIHNDWLRIVLNHRAECKCIKEKSDKGGDYTVKVSGEISIEEIKNFGH